MRRREFMKKAGAASLAFSSSFDIASADGTGLPNVLFIMTDQHFADALSCRMGSEYLHTPHIDSLAERGTFFSRAYCPNPLCVPARASIFTGRYPHETGIQTNRGGPDDINPDQITSLGRIFQQAGYDTGYFGKWHMPFRPEDTAGHGFSMTKLGGRDGKVPSRAVEFLKKDREDPFFLFASFRNPHDICQWARLESLPNGPIPEPPPISERPPLPSNHEPPENETDIMSIMRRSYQETDMCTPVGSYDEAQWRRLRWGYYRLIEKVDAQIGQILQGLRKSGLEEDTLVVFVGDHGECCGAHKWNQKTVFYDESSRVPLIFSYGGSRMGPATSPRLVQTGVDILPTLCELAAVPVPRDLPGRSVAPIVRGREPSGWRDYVVVSNKMVQGAPLDGWSHEPDGRMVRGERYKYCLYSEGRRRESLVDMKEDPGEMVNLAGNPDYADVVTQHREALEQHARDRDDSVALEMLREYPGPSA